MRDPLLSPEELAEGLAELDDWHLSEDSLKLSKRFRFFRFPAGLWFHD